MEKFHWSSFKLYLGYGKSKTIKNPSTTWNAQLHPRHQSLTWTTNLSPHTTLPDIAATRIRASIIQSLLSPPPSHKAKSSRAKWEKEDLFEIWKRSDWHSSLISIPPAPRCAHSSSAKYSARGRINRYLYTQERKEERERGLLLLLLLRWIKRMSFGWLSIPTSFPLRNIPIERSVLRMPRKVLFTRRVSIPCFRSIKGSAISWKVTNVGFFQCAHAIFTRSRSLARYVYSLDRERESLADYSLVLALLARSHAFSWPHFARVWNSYATLAAREYTYIHTRVSSTTSETRQLCACFVFSSRSFASFDFSPSLSFSLFCPSFASALFVFVRVLSLFLYASTMKKFLARAFFSHTLTLARARVISLFSLGLFYEFAKFCRVVLCVKCFFLLRIINGVSLSAIFRWVYVESDTFCGNRNILHEQLALLQRFPSKKYINTILSIKEIPLKKL